MTRRSISSRRRFAVLKRDGFACTYCGRKAGGALTLHIDHVEPFSKGGADDDSNFVTACNECNSGKSDTSMFDTAEEQVSDSLVGKFFHEMDGPDPRSQRIEAQGVIERDYGFAFGVRYFSWWDGTPSDAFLLVEKHSFVSQRFRFYDSIETWREAGDLKTQQMAKLPEVSR